MASDSVGLFTVQSHRTLFNFCWLTNKQKNRSLFYDVQWRCKEGFWPGCNSTRPFTLFYSWMKLCLGVDQQWRLFFSTMCLSRTQFLKWKTICAHVFVVLFSQSAMPFQDNGLFNEVFLHATQVAALRVATRSLRVTTQGGLGASGLKLMRVPNLYCLWKHREKRGNEDQVDWVKRKWHLWDDI